MNASLNPTDGVVLLLVLIGSTLAIAWFAVKAVARRGGNWALSIYRWVDPRVQAGLLWCARSPVTFIYVATWTVTTILIQGAPDDITALFTRFTSTNIYGIATEPVRVLLGSAFLVADDGLGYVAYVLVFALIVARAEQRLGSARIIVVGLASHVVASLITVELEAEAVRTDRVSGAIVLTTDVGVSYIMAGICAGYLLFVSARWRWWYVATLLVTLVVPLLVTGDIWSLGHFLAALTGLALTAVLRRWGVRPPLLWRDLVAAATPRPLPTWGSAAA